MASTSTGSQQSPGASRSHPAVDSRENEDRGPRNSHPHPCASTAEEEARYHTTTTTSPANLQTDPEMSYRQSSEFAYSYNRSSDERTVALLPTKVVGRESRSCPPTDEDQDVPSECVPSVETASSTATTTPGPEDTEPTIAPSSSESLRSIQFAMTLLFVLLAPAALLSLCVAQQYRFLVLTFWIFLWMLFGSLIWFLQYVTQHPTILHPVLHRMARAIVQEYRHFVTDWQNEILLLTNGTDDPPLSQQQQQQQQHDRGEENNNNETARPRPKSRIFRVLVQPLVPFLTRRRQQQPKRERTEKRRWRQPKRASNSTPPSPEDDAYSPPDYQLV